MSHTTLRESHCVEEQIKSIPALQAAALRCGLEFRINQHKFHSYATDYGRLVGDSPMPAGMTEQDYGSGECVHAIGIPQAQQPKVTSYCRHYEIGVINSRKFPGTFSLAYDSWGGGLEQFAGKNLDRLWDYYRIEAAKEQATNLGYMFEEQVQADNSIRVEITTL